MRLAALFLALSCVAALAVQSDEEKSSAKYYDKWLNQDVLYIISDDERAVFSKLQTPEEKEQFIEQFWQRRNPNPNRGGNEFREEHYRRIAYANAKYASGIPGWKTDRGRIYIMFGEPAEIEDHAGGGNYVRPSYEGGGSTNTYPFQIWRYRYIDGVGDDVEIEFVDQSWTGQYKMVMNPWEKDMLLNVDGAGETLRERLGLASRNYRPGLHPGAYSDTSRMAKAGLRSKDMPFERMLQYYNLQRPPVIQHKDLQSIVETHVTYNTLPFRYAFTYIRADSERTFFPITLEVENKGLSYKQVDEGGIYKARVGMYGAVTSLAGKIVAEFEDTIASEYRPERFEQGLQQKSLYQKTLLIPAGLNKLDLVVKDLNSGNVGTVSTSINVPRQQDGDLAASPLMLAKMIEPMNSIPDAPQSFVIGDLKVIPNVTGTYKAPDPLNVYFQVYNVGRDEAQSKPKLVTSYTIMRDQKLVSQLIDQAGTSVSYASEQRVVMARRLGLDGLQPGHYKLNVVVNDLITGQSLSRDAAFEVAAR
jgi:GWxTD domain-containing protein